MLPTCLQNGLYKAVYNLHGLMQIPIGLIAIPSDIAKRELLLIVTPEPEEVRMQISAAVNMDNVRFLECETNDTWARDHGAITMVDTEGASLLDFTFNGWGLKFASDKDNQITRRAVEAEILKGRYMSRLGFVLEGGSIESDGLGTLLTTSECLLSPNSDRHFILNGYFGWITDIWPEMIRTAI